MRLIFEDHVYAIEDVKNVLSFLLSDKDRLKRTYTPKCVGYFYNPNIDNGEGRRNGDVVFILPKVLLTPATDGSGEKETLFNVPPEKLINADWKVWRECDLKEGSLTKRDIFDFVYGFSIWIYRAIEVYRKNLRSKPKSDVDVEEEDAEIESNKSIRMGKSAMKTDSTFMDILLSLMDFHKLHHDYIMFVMKMAHSGFNKIDWTKTVARSSAIIKDGRPIYLNPVNKRKDVNFDEELLIIFYSILNYMHEEYGFPVPNNPGYTLITGRMFDSYMDKQGKYRLQKIKYKYFSDTALSLWNLCYAFFDKTSKIHAQSNTNDYLLVNSFHTVFEAMIDELIGDKELPRNLKVQEGGSRLVDSLYTYKYLIENLEEKEVDMTQKIYHVGDAKYHKRTRGLGDADVPKQFDYATNVIKWHMDLMHGLLKSRVSQRDKKEYSKIKLFDDITEGFNIIPNFFVSAKVEDLVADYKDDGITQTDIKSSKIDHEQSIFGERLFDRNTLFALHYDVKFLYVLKKYAQNRSTDKAVWREAARKQFREGTLAYLNDHFNFYQLLIADKDDTIKKFVSQFYYALHGKVFSFLVKEDGKEKRVLLYAERKDEKNFGREKATETNIEKDQEGTAKEGAKGWLMINSDSGSPMTASIQAIRLGKSGYQLGDDVLQQISSDLFYQKVDSAIEILNTSKMDPEKLKEILGIVQSQLRAYETEEEPTTVVAEEEDTYLAEPEMTGEEWQESKTSDEDIEELEIYDDGNFDAALKYTKFLPLYSIRAACGIVNHGDLSEEEGWVDVSKYGIRPKQGMFIVHAEGDSMEPKICNGELCVFTNDAVGGSRNGKIVLIETNDRDHRHAIKEYHSRKVETEEGWEHESITLHSLNPKYKDFDITEEDEPRVAGLFVGVLR